MAITITITIIIMWTLVCNAIISLKEELNKIPQRTPKHIPMGEMLIIWFVVVMLIITLAMI